MCLSINEKSCWDSHVFQYSKYTKPPWDSYGALKRFLYPALSNITTACFTLLHKIILKNVRGSLDVGTWVTSKLKDVRLACEAKRWANIVKKFNCLTLSCFKCLSTFLLYMFKMQFNSLSITATVWAFSNNLKQTRYMESPSKVKLFFINLKSATPTKTLNKQQTTVTCYQH